MVSWRRDHVGTDIDRDSPPSPTKQAVPQVRVLRTAAIRPAAVPEVSSVRSAPRPWVSALMAPIGSFEPGSTVASAPKAWAPRQPLGADIERDHARAHRRGELGRRQPDWTLAEDRDGVAARQVDPPQRAVGRAGAARDRGAGRERQRVGQGNQRARRHLHVGRMRAVPGHAVDRDAAGAELRPADPAMLAHAAADIMMDHDAVADPGNPLGDAGADRRDHAAGLVAGDHRAADLAQAEPFRPRLGAIGFQVAAAHARRLDLEHDLTGAGRRVGQLDQLDLAVAGEHDSAHRILPDFRAVIGARVPRS